MKRIAMALFASTVLSQAVFAAELPGFQDGNEFQEKTGVGFVVKSKTEGQSPIIGAVSLCSVRKNGSEVRVVSEVDPGFSGSPVGFDLANAAREEAEEGRLVTFKQALTPGLRMHYCGGVLIEGSQTLVTVTDSEQPIYTLMTEMTCQKGDQVTTRSYIARCDMNFSRR